LLFRSVCGIVRVVFKYFSIYLHIMSEVFYEDSKFYYRFKSVFKAFIYSILSIALLACTADDPNMLKFELVIENHRFSPEEIIIPSNTKVKLIIHNNDDSAEEFECLAIRKEKLVPAKSTVSVIIPALQSGMYDFFGEFHPNSAIGKIKVQ
jgi:hypothetical protein